MVRIKLEAEEGAANSLSVHLLFKVGGGSFPLGLFPAVQGTQSCLTPLTLFSGTVNLHFPLPGWCQTETGPVAASASPKCDSCIVLG